jgi:phospholipase C
MRRMFRFLTALGVTTFVLGCSGGGGSVPVPPPTSPSLSKIHHVIIIFQENRTPDNLFHGLPGADIATSGVNSQGQTVPLRPVSLNIPYDIDHSHGAFLLAFNSGQMNGWDLESIRCPSKDCDRPTSFGYVPPAEVGPYFALAKRYTFGDRMFQTNQGPSFPAHQYIISGTSTNASGSVLLAAENPHYADRTALNCDGSPLSVVQMIDPAGSERLQLRPCFEHLTLFDLLDAKGVSWRYYDARSFGGLWSGPNAISHIRFGPDWANVTAPGSKILDDIAARQLPNVSWVIPTAAASDHALVTDGSGPNFVAAIVNAVGQSPYWSDTAIFITWDDWGGWYDHVPPPIYGSNELGFRVPLIVVSPYARQGYVSHVQHEFGSILHFIESNYGLANLGYTDVRADALLDCFDFTRAPLTFQPIPAARSAPTNPNQPPSTIPPDGD